MKKLIISAAAAAVAVAAGVKTVQFLKEPVNERIMRLEGGYKKLLSLPARSLKLDAPKKESQATQPYITCSERLDAPAKGAKWSLGYAQKSIMPRDIETKSYCIAGVTKLPANYSVGALDDVRVRTIVIDDGSSRGAHAFAAVDCIGLSNYYVRLIRAELAEFCRNNGILSVNISSTHTHSGIDTMGIWGPIAEVAKNNRRVLKKGKGKLKSSIDDGYMEFLCSTVSESVREAYSAMEPGKLYKSVIGADSKEGIDYNLAGEGNIATEGIGEYVWDRRAPIDCSPRLFRLRFKPDSGSRETLLVNFAAHPYINSASYTKKGDGKHISGDFVYHLDEYLKRADYNCIFINGAIAAVYPKRLYADVLLLDGQAHAVGEELGRVALAMTQTSEQIKANPLLSPEKWEAELGIFNNGTHSQYSKWLERKGSFTADEEELKPLLNLAHKEVPLTVDNPIYSAIGKLGIGHYEFSGSEENLRCNTEVGLLELGGTVKAVLIPGELEPSIASGSLVMHGENSTTGNDFPGRSLADITGTHDVLVFGLTNDEIGYIIPDNDFCMFFVKSKSKLFGNHYLEIFSFGKATASTLTDAVENAASDVPEHK